MAVTTTDALSPFVPELWAPVGGVAQSSYVIRELKDAVVIWRRREVRRGPLPYLAVLLDSAVATQADAAALRDATSLMHATLDSPVVRLSAGGVTIVFDSLDDLRTRLAWSAELMYLWRAKERIGADYAAALARFDRAAYGPRDPGLYANAWVDEEGC